MLDRIRACFPKSKLRELLEDHIASEPIEEMKTDHTGKLGDIEAIPKAEERHRRPAVLMMEIVPEGRIKELLETKK